MNTPRELLHEAREKLRKLSRMFRPSDAPKLPAGRTIQDVQNEYNRVAVELGHRIMSQEKLQAEHEEIADRLKARGAELRAEGDAISQRAQQEAAAKPPDLKVVPKDKAG